jgi:hypothetical protein
MISHTGFNSPSYFPAIVEQDQGLDTFISQEDVESIASRIRRRSSYDLSTSCNNKLPLNVLSNTLNSLVAEAKAVNETKAKKSKKKKSYK